MGAPGGGWLPRRAAQGLERACGQGLRDRAALDGDLGVRRDFDRHVLLAEFGDASEQPAGGDDFVPLLERLEHRPRLLRLLLLRPDEQEVKDDENRDHRQERHQVAAEGCRGRTLRVRRGDQEVDQHVLVLRKRGLRECGPLPGRPDGAGREWKACYSTTPAPA